MPTGACGINCDVCKLRLLRICSSCGSGRSVEAKKKLEAQKKAFGGSCTILACACLNNKEYCMRDCNSFPCENFSLGPYPFGKGFLEMQERRLREVPPAFDTHGNRVKVPDEYWEALKTKDINVLSNLTLGNPYASDGLIIRSLREDILVDIMGRCIKRLKNRQWLKTDDPLLELITLVYLNRVSSFHPLGKEIVSKNDLKEAHFFVGLHDLNVEALLERYANDIDGFKKAAEYLGGSPVKMADAAYMLLPFPRVPLYYLFWQGDDEFETRIDVLFDRSIEEYFSASGIWGLVNLVSTALLKGPGDENLDQSLSSVFLLNLD
ncbi:conserved hypothetical protein [uncultured Desulfobacterium sp.]|uniref:DUF3786 domain-containing protein n=1 Tax=uncultured Desulfobacterium sp. TaxID=201089 RepID=A0A445N190_9BACT|nr:conserved hypothetical protein [uncultured Desulfobacterium sp.]